MKRMNAWANLEFLCRVCAVNTRAKNSVAECVYILKTPGLKSKVEKYLYLKVSKFKIYFQLNLYICRVKNNAKLPLNNS